MDTKNLILLANYQMPYGKYKGVALIDLPEPYVCWMMRKGLPEGKLGQLLALLFEVKANGLEYLIEPLKRNIDCENSR